MVQKNIQKDKLIDVQKEKLSINIIYEACESTCHECSAKNELRNGKEDSIVEKADLIMKKDMGNKEIMREKENMKICPQYKKSSGNHSCWNPHEKRISLCVCHVTKHWHWKIGF